MDFKSECRIYDVLYTELFKESGQLNVMEKINSEYMTGFRCSAFNKNHAICEALPIILK